MEDTVDYLLNLPRDILTGRPMIENIHEVQKVLATLKEQNVKRIGLLGLQKVDEKGKFRQDAGISSMAGW